MVEQETETEPADEEIDDAGSTEELDVPSSDEGELDSSCESSPESATLLAVLQQLSRLSGHVSTFGQDIQCLFSARETRRLTAFFGAA
jgi:hypothetical protein